MPIETSLIVFCGVDGVGKSSLVDELEQRDALPNCAYLRRPKTDIDNGALISRYALRQYGDGRDWISGNFAEAMGVALAYDYLKFYDDSIHPLLGHKRFIMCDRYVLCFLAYLRSINSSFPIEGAFSKVKMPELAFYIQLPESVRSARLVRRGGMADDEHPVVSNNFHEAYLRLLPYYAQRYYIVDNSGTLDSTVTMIMEALNREFLEEIPPHQKERLL